MKLTELQSTFIQSLHNSANTKLLNLIISDETMGANEKLAIYQNTAKFVLIETLEQNYPVCLNILGEDYFHQLAKLYIQKYPSTSSDLNTYGQHLDNLFNELLQSHHELNDFPYLSDLSKLEQIYHHVYYAKDNRIFNFEKFESMTTQGRQDIYFEISESTVFMQSKYPILEIWEANSNKNKNTKVVQHTKDLSFLCVHRINDTVQIKHITKESYHLASMIQQGLNLQELAKVSTEINTLIPQFIQLGWIDLFYLR